MRILGILIIAVLSPLLANAATFGPEIAIAQPQHGAAYGLQFSDDVACSNQSCVALWVNNSRPGIYSSVVDANGNVQPASSNLVVSGNARAASIVWAGDHYLAAWVDSDHNALAAAPLSSDGRVSGAVREAGPFPISAPTALAWNGTHAFAVFGTTNHLNGAILDATGTVIRKVALPANGNGQPAWAVAASGKTFGVVWIDTVFPNLGPSVSTVKFQRYCDDGSPLDSAPITLGQGSAVDFVSAAVAGNATQFMIAFPAFNTGVHAWKLFSVHVDPSTGAIDPIPATPFIRDLAGLYWSGDDFVAYGADADQYATTGSIVTAGLLSGTLHSLNVAGPNMSSPRLAPSATGAVAIWSDPHLGVLTQHVFGALLGPDATSVVKSGLSISLSTLPQTVPVLAPSGNGALLVWAQSYDDYFTDIVARRINAAGTPIDDGPVALATDVATGPFSAVWLGNAWLVVWAQLDMSKYPDNVGRIRGMRISASGELLDASPIEYGPGTECLLATNGPTVILASWSGKGVAFVRLNANGQPIDSQPIAVTLNNVSGLAAATNGNEFLLAWTELTGQLAPEGNGAHLYAVRLTATGQPIETAPIAIDTHSLITSEPAIASDGRDFLIAYLSYGETTSYIVTKRLLAEGSLAGSTAQDDGVVVSHGGLVPRMAWDGSEYIIAWTILPAGGYAVAGTTADRSGAITDTARSLGSSAGYRPTIQPAVANVQGTVIVAYPRANAEDGLPQMVTRRVSSGPPRARAVHR